MSINTSRSDLVQIGELDVDLAEPERGFVVGNRVTIATEFTTNISHLRPTTVAALGYRWLLFNESTLRDTSFTYRLTDLPADAPGATANPPQPGQMRNEWTDVTSAFFGYAGRAHSGPRTIEAVLDAGVNHAVPVYADIGYALPAYDCWFGICTRKTIQGSSRTNLGPFFFDVLPATLSEFYDLQSWSTRFRVQNDADGDGLVSATWNGNDPNDSITDCNGHCWDSDGDGLSDRFEIERRAVGAANGGYALNPRLGDTDGDGLTDQREIRLGTNPALRDTDGDGLTDAEEVAGWLFTYAPGRTTQAFPDPLQADGDGDGMSDLLEKRLYEADPVRFPFHPRAFNPSPVALYTELDDADSIVRPGDDLVYNAIVRNNLDAAADKVYWTARTQIRRANLDGGGIENITNPEANAIHDIDLAYVDVPVLPTATPTPTPTPSPTPTAIFTPLPSPTPGGPAPASDIYWSDDVSSLRHAPAAGCTDGSCADTLVSGEFFVNVRVDSLNGHIYWRDPEAELIRRANLDGSGLETVNLPVVAPLSAFDLDPAVGHLYWTEGDAIRRADLDGSNAITIATGLNGPTVITVDGQGDKLYWLEVAPFPQQRLLRSDLNGANVETILFDDGSSAPRLLGSVNNLVVDSQAGWIFWRDIDFNEVSIDRIRRLDLNGANLISIYEAVDGSGGDIAIDPVSTAPLIDAIRFSGLVTESVGIQGVEVQIDGGTWRQAVSPMAGGVWRYIRTPVDGFDPALVNLDGGTVALNVRVTDVAGRTAQASRTVTVDTTQPAPTDVTFTLQDGTPITSGQTIFLSAPVLVLNWGDHVDGSGIADIYAGWTENNEAEPADLTRYDPTARSHSQPVLGEALQRYAHVIAVDVHGNQQIQRFGPFFVDSPATPDRVSDLSYSGWMNSGATQIGADRTLVRRAAGSSQPVQSLFTSWDEEAIRFAWTGANWDNDGDLFIYLDTAPGGATAAYNPHADGVVVNLPVEDGQQLAADYLLWVSSNVTATLLSWNGDWSVAQVLTDSYRFNGDQTDLLLPFTWLNITDPAATSLSLVAFAAEENGLRLWASIPDKQPLNSERVLNSRVDPATLVNLSLTQFLGVNDHVALGTGTPVSTLSNNFSVAALINLSSTVGNGQHRIIAGSRRDSNAGWGFGVQNRGLRFTTFGVRDYDSTLINLPTGSWVHVAAVMDSDNNVTFYVNGVAVQTVTGNAPGRVNAADPMLIGATTPVGSATPTAFFSGQMDDLSVYDFALTPDQVSAVAAGAELPPPTGRLILDAPLDVDGDLILNEGTLDVNSSENYTVTLGGDFVANLGRFNAHGGTVIFDGNGAQNIDALNITFNNVIIDNGSQGLVGQWSLDEFVNGRTVDATSYGNAATVFGATEADPSPAGGRSLRFDGVNDYAVIGNPGVLNFSGPIAVTAWVRPESTTGLRNIVAHGHNLHPHGEVVLRINNGSYQFLAWNGANHIVSAPMPAADLNTWVHLAGVYDGTHWRLYRNGVEIAAAAGATGAVLVAANWAIGARGTGTERFFRGGIDEVRIYNRALTAQEVANLLTAARSLSTEQDRESSGVALAAPLQISGTLTLQRGVLDTSPGDHPLTLGGDLMAKGGQFNARNGAVTFAGEGTQQIEAEQITLANVTVNAGVELQTEAPVMRTGALESAGRITELRHVDPAPTGEYTSTAQIHYGFAEVALDLTEPGNFQSLQITRIDEDSPNSSPTTRTGKHWLFEAGGSGYSVDLSLGHDNVRNPGVCLHLGEGEWDFFNDNVTPETVTRLDVSALDGEWSVGFQPVTDVQLYLPFLSKPGGGSEPTGVNPLYLPLIRNE